MRDEPPTRRRLIPQIGFDGAVQAFALLLVCVLVVLPIGFLLYSAFSSGAPGERGASLTFANVQTVYLTDKYLGALVNSLWLAFVVTALVTVVGTLFAWLVARTDIPGKKLLELLLVVPIFISSLLGTLAWIALAAPGSGFINALGRTLFGLTGDVVDIFNWTGIVFVMFLYFVPYTVIFTIGTLKNLDPALEDAVRTIGGGLFATMRHVTIPLALPALGSSALLVFIFAAEVFTVPTMLAVRSGFDTIPMLLYLGRENRVPPGETAALATLLLWITFLGIYLYRRMVALSRRFVTVSGKGYAPRTVALGRWRHAGAAVIWLYIGVAVVLPYAALALGSLLKFLTPRLRAESFTLDNYAGLLQTTSLAALGNTLVLGIVGSTLTVLIAFIVSFLIVRRRGRLIGLVDYLGSLPAAVPGLALAIGLLWAYTILPLPVYGTILMLLVAYVTRFMSYGIRVASAGLQQIDPELEEAGRLAGLSSLGTFRVVTLPLLKSSAIAVWTLVFVLCVIEVTTTILLYTSQTRTLSITLWNALQTSGSTVAFTIGMLQVSIVFVVLAIMRRLTGTVSMRLD